MIKDIIHKLFLINNFLYLLCDVLYLQDISIFIISIEKKRIKEFTLILK